MSRTGHEQLAARLRGALVTPEDPGYDRARRVWNGMVDARPALVVRCEGTADVVACLDHASSTGLAVTVRGGGHGVSGRAVADGALVIDLAPMDSVQVDPRTRTARVGAGATWRQVDHETQAFGLAVTGGVDSRTGVAGLALGGGVGHLVRHQGMTIDHLREMEVVLVDGTVVIASAESEPELFWALRGGGGSFGVVTSFGFDLHPLGPEVMSVQAFHRLEGAADVLRGYREVLQQASDEVGCYALLVPAPPLEVFPAELHGKTVLALVGCHASQDLAQAEEGLRPLAELGEPVLRSLAPTAYTTLQSSFDAGAPDGARYFWKAAYLPGLADEILDLLVSRCDRLPGAYSNVFLEPLGGAMARVEPGATAFPHRDAAFGLGISSGWDEPADDDRGVAWTRSLARDLAPYGTGGAYANYLDRDDQDRAQLAWGANVARLRQAKEAYDPDGVLTGNVTVPR